jgi:tetratricopeptide (TPR) repeat protein
LVGASEELYALALEADQHLLGPEQGAWLERLERQRQPLSALLEQLIAAVDGERALRLAGALAAFWWMRGHTATGREQMARALALPGGSAAARAAALVGAGSLDYAAGDFRGARRHYEAALPLLRSAGREFDLAHALDRAGMAARQLMELAEAQALHAEALAVQRRAGTPAGQALCLNNLGVVTLFRGHLDAAGAYHHEALTLREQAGDVRGQASSLNNLGQVARWAGEPAAARAWLEQGLALRRQLGDRWGVAGSQVNLAALHADLGDSAAARTHLREAVAGFQAVADPLGLCECLEVGAELAQAEGRWADAVRSYAAAARGRASLPAPRSPLLERTVAARLIDLRGALGAEAFAAAWREGHEDGPAILQSFG